MNFDLNEGAEEAGDDHIAICGEWRQTGVEALAADFCKNIHVGIGNIQNELYGPGNLTDELPLNSIAVLNYESCVAGNCCRDKGQRRNGAGNRSNTCRKYLFGAVDDFADEYRIRACVWRYRWGCVELS